MGLTADAMQLLNALAAHNGRPDLTRRSPDQGTERTIDVTVREPFADGPPTGDDEPPTDAGSGSPESDEPSPEIDEASPPDDALTTEEFESALAALLRSAARGDVAAPRSVDVAGRSGSTAWMVEITRIDRRR